VWLNKFQSLYIYFGLNSLSLEGIIKEDDKTEVAGYRRISTASSVSGYGTESEKDPQHLGGTNWRWSYRKGIN